jgi:CheY-like chemotaxis protein
MYTILLIEDDEQFCSMLGKCLHRAGFEIQTAADGHSALKLYRISPSDLVITDLFMPEKEGLETIMELRRMDPRARIIAISGGWRADPQGPLSVARLLGARRILTKPFTPAQIVGAIVEVMEEEP